MLNDIDFWSTALWSYYLEVLKKGTDFYLAADSHLIERLARSHGGEPIDVLQGFHAACNQAFIVKKNGARLKKETFKVREAGHSRAICLAVQQVLVVEQMLAEETKYSELEYFPRYRATIGVLGGRENLNPLDEDFAAIWMQLEHELREAALPNIFHKTFGPGRGRLKNSNYPLSQALFTTEDLLRIQKDRGKSIDSATTTRAIFQILRQIGRSNILGSRARNLIRKCDADTEERLCNQVRSFATVLELAPKSTKEVTKRSTFYFAAERAEDDYFSDRFNIYIQQNDGSISEPDVDVVEELGEYFQDVNFLILAFRDFRYLEVTAREPLVDETKAIVVIPTTFAASFSKQFQQLYDRLPVTVDNNVQPDYTVFWCIDLDEKFCKAFGVSVEVKSTSARIELTGGMRVDSRTDIFLAGYPPTGLWQNNRPVDSSTVIQIGEIKISLADFFKSLEEIRDYKSYFFTINEQRVEFELSIAPFAVREFLDLGFRFEESSLEPFVDSLSSDEAGLRGSCLTTHKNRLDKQTELSRMVTVSTLVGLIKPGKRFQLSEAAQGALIAVLHPLSFRYPAAALAAKQVQQTRSVSINGLTRGLIHELGNLT